ncbi:hypothetical protein SLP22_0069 [Salmonella phage BAU.Micro_SLP-22]
MYTKNRRKPLIYIEIRPTSPKNDILAVFTEKPNETQQRRGLPVYTHGAYFKNLAGGSIWPAGFTVPAALLQKPRRLRILTRKTEQHFLLQKPRRLSDFHGRFPYFKNLAGCRFCPWRHGGSSYFKNLAGA